MLLCAALVYLRTHGFYGDAGEDCVVLPTEFLLFLLQFCPKLIDEQSVDTQPTAPVLSEPDRVDMDELRQRFKRVFGHRPSATEVKRYMTLGMPGAQAGKRYRFSWSDARDWFDSRLKACPNGGNVLGDW